jgi:hypothetical protein
MILFKQEITNKEKYMTMAPSKTSTTPFRQIRADYNDETITVYQAYSKSIAEAAVKEQKLSASPNFLFSRMTWIKPSFCWMMYRSNYGTKDNRQTNILAITMTHANFRKLLIQAAVCSGSALSAEESRKPVRVQWDPERSPAIGMLDYRSLQVGIGREIVEWWVGEGIEAIRDVTDMAAKLKQCIEESKELRKMGKGKTVDELVEMGCLPMERVYEVDEELKKVLKMDLT